MDGGKVGYRDGIAESERQMDNVGPCGDAQTSGQSRLFSGVLSGCLPSRGNSTHLRLGKSSQAKLCYWFVLIQPRPISDKPY